MRKYLLIIALLLIMGLVGCNNKSMNYIIENEPSITGSVTEVHDKYIQIYIKNGGYPYGADCNVSLDVENSDGLYSPIKVGDEVVVYYDGAIAESDPMQINKVYAITLQTPSVREGSYTQISMQEAVDMMQEETEYIILDVRTVEEFAEKHIPNAINIPNEVIGDEEIAELPDKEQTILVYCRSGNRSKQASEKLVALGYTNVYEFGGINDWTGETVSE
jgi:rhodanese-related sulfurtransferase